MDTEQYRNLIGTLADVLDNDDDDGNGNGNLKDRLHAWCKGLGNKSITLYLIDEEMSEELQCYGPNPDPGIFAGSAKKDDRYSILNIRDRFKIVIKEPCT
jgi:hypothetical protein